MRDTGLDEFGKRFFPRGEGLARKAGNEVDVQIRDSCGAQTSQIVVHHGAVVQATADLRLAIDERLDAETDAIYASTRHCLEG